MCPVFQTSANFSGEFAPGSFEQVPAEIVDGADLAIDGGALTGVPSTVIDISRLEETGEWEVLRAGGLSEGDLVAKLASSE
jgi:tRNA A37 threonylcarbamoyladenosine synthetase subunit TsaC/SUA5/YrdC